MSASTIFAFLLIAGVMYLIFRRKPRDEESGIKEHSHTRKMEDSNENEHHSHHNQNMNLVDAYVDPVCGMAVETDNAAGIEHYKGIAYYFCSEMCHSNFAKNPEEYLEREEATVKRHAHRNGGHGCCG